MPQDRRSFVSTLGVALGAAALGCRPRTEDGAAAGASAASGAGSASAAGDSATASAGGVGPVGLQLYTVRDAMKQDFDGTLARVAQLGYREVEFAGYFDRDPKAVRATLDRVGLTAPSAHIPLDDITSRLPQVIEAAKVVGHQWIVLPFLTPEQRGRADDWKRLAERLNAAGRQTQAAGMRMAYHNHAFELERVDGQVPLELLIANTDAALVDFEMDLYWMTQAGEQPLEWFRRHPGRFALLHLKDSKGPPQHEMTSVGSGTIDFARILAARGQAGVKHQFVEHDNPADVWASVSESIGYLGKLQVPAAG